MNKALLFSVFCLLFSFSLFAQPAGQGKMMEAKQKGASEAAYEHASGNAIFNRIGDWFATLGKSKEESAKIIKERKSAREHKKMNAQLQKKKKEMKQGMENITAGLKLQKKETTLMKKKEETRVNERIRGIREQTEGGAGYGKNK